MPAMTRSTDAELIPGLIARDEAAVADLLDRYWERAYRVVFQLTRDPGAAEDVAQETFVQVLQRVDSLRDPERFRGWFFGILRNTAKTRRRGETRRAKREQRAAQRELTRDRDLSEGETHALVREHLAALPFAFRAALSLRFLEGLSLAEVARAMDCPEGTVSSRIRRGLARLEESLAPRMQLGASVTPLLIAACALEAPAAPAALEVLAGAEAGGLAVPSAPAPAALIAQGAGAASRRTAWLAGLVALLLLGIGAAFVLDGTGDAERVGLQDAADGAGPERPVPGEVATPAGDAARPGDPPAADTARPGETPEPASDPDVAGDDPAAGAALAGTLAASRLEDAWVARVTPEQLAALRDAQSLTAEHDALLTALGRAHGSWNVPAGSAAVAADGSFRLDLPPGRHWIAAGARGCPTRLQELELPSSAPLTLELEYQEPAALVLKLHDCDGGPLAGRELSLIRMGAPGLLRFPGLRDFDYQLTGIETDAEGRIALALPASSCEVAVHLVQDEAAVDGNFVDHGSFPGVSFGLFRERVALSPGQPTVVDVANDYARFRVQVQDVHGAPLPNAWVRLFPARSRLAQGPLTALVNAELAGSCRQTDAHGELRMGWLPRGNYTLVARDRLDGDRAGRVSFEVERLGEEVQVELRLDARPRLGSVELSLIDAAGEPGSGRYRAALLEDGYPVRFTKLRAADGRASWTDLPSGDYELAVWRKRHAAFRAPVRIEPGGALALEVREPATRSLSGTVVGAGALDGVTLQVNPLDARPGRRWTGPRFSTNADADGRFTLEQLPRDRDVELVVRAPGHFTFAVAVPAGADDVQVVLPSAPRVELRVERSDGSPAAEVPLWLTGEDGRYLGGGDTDAEGRLVLLGELSVEGRLSVDRGNEQPLGPFTGDTQTTIAIPTGERVEVAGVVRDASGAPLAGARLVAKRENMSQVGDRKLGQTDAQGRFRVSLTPGASTIVVEQPGYAPETQTWEVPSGGLREHLVELSQGSTLVGRMTGREQLRVQRWSLRGPRPAREVFAQGDGGFDFGRVPAGRWTLEALSASGARLGSWSVEVADGGALNLSLAPQAGK